MRKAFFIAIAPASLLFRGPSLTQYKYIKRNSDASKENKTGHFVAKMSDGDGGRKQGVAPGSTGRRTGVPAEILSGIRFVKRVPPLVNNPSDIYTGNPVLTKATLTIHLGEFIKSPGPVNFSFYSDPYYDYHTGSGREGVNVETSSDDAMFQFDQNFNLVQ